MQEGIDLLPNPVRDELLERANREGKNRAPHHMYVSELTRCLRESYFKRVEGRPEHGIQTAWYFFRGNWLDAFFNEQMPISQKRVTLRFDHKQTGDPLRISGYFDYRDDDGIITDLKTTKTLYYLKKRGKPNYSHQLQVNFYGYCEAEQYVRLLYVDISGAEVAQFTMEVNPNLVWRLREGANKLYTALQEHDPSTLPTAPKSYMCKYCDYSEQCDGA